MENEVSYEDWPASVKLSTALSVKSFAIKSQLIPKGLGYLLVLMGLGQIAFFIYKIGENQNYDPVIVAWCYILIGMVNIVNAYSIKWVNQHSSWEERFRNHAPLNYRLVGIGLLLLMFVALYLIYTYTL